MGMKTFHQHWEKNKIEGNIGELAHANRNCVWNAIGVFEVKVKSEKNCLKLTIDEWKTEKLTN